MHFKIILSLNILENNNKLEYLKYEINNLWIKMAD